MLTIRKATIDDAAHIATFLFLAMEDIVYKFIGAKDADKALAFFLYFTHKEDNQYSYTKCFVAELDGHVVAAANVYNGADLHQLREPVVQYIHSHYNPAFQPEDETQAGEYYLDCLAVHPQHHGKGYGSAMLRFLIQEYVVKHQQPIGLLVDEDNPNAKRLYIKMGFVSDGVKLLFGKQMEHLQITSSK